MLQLSTSEENAVKKNSCGPEELESITYGDIILLVVSSEKEVVEMDLASPSSSMFRESHSFPGNPLNNFLIWTVYRAISFPTLQKESSDGLDWRRRFRKEYAVTQFIVDSGVASSSSILCTQPRKIDSISLGKSEECNGCYKDNSIVCCPSYSFAQEFCLKQRPDSWSVTVDASKSFTYFFGCGTFQVLGRSFPIEIKCAPAVSRESLDSLPSSSIAALYVSDVIEMGMEIHASTSAIALPLHGKLSHEEQSRVFQNYPGKRELVFATNLAETSLTIPGVKYVVDSELVKHDWFESSSGMNALRVSKEPEICKVLLDIAVLRIPASGIKNVLGFDFIDDAPSADAINNIRILV
ncbi:hypothetical protein NC653_002583 [Populus alba x Populus x berolinensis]|uniref:RNA helicase n=2 Tax=Populus TaxID=3689 RepID=A0A4U5PVS3_POPAL|nr:hypothetical protein NC653_002583 [Populus alba x Populus x berolinensis]TKS01500.1 hypothetical protein D5086_0000172110 [Populus alba]